MSQATDPPTVADERPVFRLPDFEEEPLFLVDDDDDVRQSLGRSLTRAGFRVRSFSTPQEALEEVERSAPRVIVTDKHMPGLDGLELAEQALQIDPNIRIIVVTGAGDEEAAQAALRLGAADYVTKPVEVRELARSVLRAYGDYAHERFARSTREWLEKEVRRRTGEIRELTLGTLASLMNALEARSPHFRGHSRSVGETAEGIARALELPAADVEVVRTAGLLHDIGMIAVPDDIVDKPGDLTPEEFEAVRAHCERGREILEPLAHLRKPAQYVLEHHERLDGSGYPRGLEGDDISLGGRIVGLAESWTAMTEDRPYRDRLSKADAMSTLVAAADLWYPASLIEALRVSELG